MEEILHQLIWKRLSEYYVTMSLHLRGELVSASLAMATFSKWRGKAERPGHSPADHRTSGPMGLRRARWTLSWTSDLQGGGA